MILNTPFFFHSQWQRFRFWLIEGLNEELNQIKAQKIATLEDRSDVEAINQILQLRVRSEKLAVKDEKLRTFIADDGARNQMVSHIYDVTLA